MPHSSLIGHVEIPVSDLEEAKKFYDQLFGWDFKPFGNSYYLYNSKGTTVGLRKCNNINKDYSSTIFHVRVDDVEAVMNKAEILGGRIFRNKTIIPVYGYYALIHDADGNTVGVYQDQNQ